MTSSKENQRPGLVAYLLNLAQFELELPRETIPGFILRKASPIETKFISDFLRSGGAHYPNMIRPYEMRWNFTHGMGGSSESDPAKWHYHVFEYPAEDHHMNNRSRLKAFEMACAISTGRLHWGVMSGKDMEFPLFNRDLFAELDRLQRQMQQALERLDTGMPHNPGVKILQRPQGWIRVAKMARQPDPPNLAGLKAEITRRWPLTGLLDVLKETELRVGFTQHFTGTGSRSALDDETLQRRLLLCLFGLGSNAGLKRVCATPPGEQYHDILYVRRRYLHPDALRNAIAEVVNAIFRIRASHIWGEGTTACASDAKQFGAWDQNLLTEWHMRYGGRGVMIYWHVEKHATCIYSQLKTCSSSEVAFMLEGLLRHGTEMEVEKNYVDSGGQSEVGFAFCHLLGFHLLPRLKGIHRQKLYRPIAGHPDAYPHLQTILERPIRWDLIRQQYDQMIKYATALRLGTADADTILKRFTRSQFQHPTYRAIIELGKAIKTVFLCQYLHEDALRREINDGLQVVENWNSANDFIFFGKGGEIATNRFEDQELAMLSLHLLQISLVYINTLMIQQVLADQAWLDRMTPDDWRALTPLIYAHINPYGTFELDMQKRLHLEAA